MSAYFSVCVLSRTEKSYNYSVGFRIFLSEYFETDRIIVIFLCVPKKRTKKFVTHRAIQVSSSAGWNSSQFLAYFNPVIHTNNRDMHVQVR